MAIVAFLRSVFREGGDAAKDERLISLLVRFPRHGSQIREMRSDELASLSGCQDFAANLIKLVEEFKGARTHFLSARGAWDALLDAISKVDDLDKDKLAKVAEMHKDAVLMLKQA